MLRVVLARNEYIFRHTFFERYLPQNHYLNRHQWAGLLLWFRIWIWITLELIKMKRAYFRVGFLQEHLLTKIEAKIINPTTTTVTAPRIRIPFSFLNKLCYSWVSFEGIDLPQNITEAVGRWCQIRRRRCWKWTRISGGIGVIFRFRVSRQR